MYKRNVLLSVLTAGTFISLQAQQMISDKALPGSFEIVSATHSSVICTDPADLALIQRSASWLQQDVEMVTGQKITIAHSIPTQAKSIIIIGTIEKSSLIRQLVQQKKLNVDKVKDKWDAYLVQTISNPFNGINSALVITGGNKRGVAYGAFELSKQIGVSPWYWWADVPVKKKSALYVKSRMVISDAPKVKYRGIFINDEAPAFSGWTKEKFGGVNHLVYEKMFELLLRLKGNYLWPAMWGNAFNDDDTLNPILADEYGIVMGTSHHEPMLRAQQEWRRYGKGRWDYDSNEARLKDFWRKGIQNMGTHESIVTVGMRGDGDMPMTRGTAIALLERIVKDQRQIIEEVTGKPASQTPQLWALYKEVQDYYDQGMRVPDDVTLLLCDDNWGNIRKLPHVNEKPRTGGYGIYYHFDYVGGPRNYKWLNTNPLPRVWEQMHLAYEQGVKQIWVVNVGDLKPMEFPISFWMDYSWNPGRIGANDLLQYTEQWAAGQFGSKHAKEIAALLSGYAKINGRKKPEMLDANTYSFNYGEWDNVVKTYNSLLKKAEEISGELPSAYQDAYFQLVLHPIKASANLNEMYYNVARNTRAYNNKWKETNLYADKVKQLYLNDSLITREYHLLNNGKWNHMMDQKHIGYRSWQEPRFQTMPSVKYLPADSSRSSVDTAMKSQEAVYPRNTNRNLFYELNGYVSIEADHFTNATGTGKIQWQVLPDHGRTGSAITPFPVTAAEQQPAGASPHVEYEFYTYDTGSFKIYSYFSPTYNFFDSGEGLQFAMSIDDGTPQVISINKESKGTESGIMYRWVADNIIVKNSQHSISKPGKHVLKYWMVNPCVVLQKLVLDFGGVKQSYLGPPETIVNLKK